MAFGFFKKQEAKPMTTLEEVKKAYEDLSDDDKKKFHQPLKDRIDESVAAQEKEHDQEDSQTAKDRVDEAEGAEKADEKREETEEKAEEPHEGAEGKSEGEKTEEAPEESHEEAAAEKGYGMEELQAVVEKAIAPLVARLDKLERSPRPADAGVSDKLSAMKNIFEN